MPGYRLWKFIGWVKTWAKHSDELLKMAAWFALTVPTPDYEAKLLADLARKNADSSLAIHRQNINDLGSPSSAGSSNEKATATRSAASTG